MFGGESNTRFSYETTWSYNVAANTWTRLETAVHPARADGAAAAYDAESDRIIFLFSTRLDSTAPRGLVRLSETWAFDVSRGTWTDMKPAPAPFGLMGARMAYDAESDRIVLFGGADFTKPQAEWFNATWAYDFNSNTWTEMHPEVAPPGRSYFGMSYDAAADRTLVFAGSPPDASANLWAYDYNTNSWQAVTYSGSVQPDHHPFMVYAPNLDRTLYMVNESFSAFDYATRTWQALDRDPRLGVRHFLAMAFDEATKKVIVFGGGPRGLHYDNATWVYDTDAGTWAQMGPN